MSVIERAKQKYQIDESHWKNIYLAAERDLDFLSDDLYAQWDFEDANRRADSGRPVLTIDQLSQFIHQVANDIRMNTPAIAVIPSGDEASVETAEIYKGLIRNIEYKSQADDAYDLAADFAVRCSIGFITITNDYEDDETFNQELRINRVVDPFMCMIDSNSVQVDGRDAMHGYVLEPMSVRDFKDKYKDKPAISFTDKETPREAKDDETILLARYYEIEEQEQDVAMLEDGSIVSYGEGVKFRLRRKIKKRIVRCYVLSGQDILEESIFPGKYVPIVPVYGEEMWRKGKRHLHSLIRKSKDAQRMYNYWKSLETELLQKQPKAPVMVGEGQIEDYAEDWKNPDKAMALRYKATDLKGNPLPPPQRLEPPVIPTGIVNAARETVEDIKSTMGLYNASIGQRSNETSGIAIARRQEEGSVATYHFADNLNKSITHIGRILVCAIPEVYDASRVIRIIDEEENPKEVGINGMITDEQEVSYDLTRGKYDVKVIPGASYTTRRQETVQAMTELFARQPDLMMIMGDLYFKNSDFTGAQTMAERMRKAMDSKFLEENEEVDPEKEQMRMALEQSGQAIAQMEAQLVEMEKRLKDKQAELMIKAKDAENQKEVDIAKVEIDRLKLMIDQQKLDLEREKFQAEYEYKAAELIARENAAQEENALAAMAAQSGFTSSTP